MLSSPPILRLIALSVSSCLLAQSAWGIVRWNEGKDQVYVSASVAVGVDSNIYAAATGGSDTTYSSSLGLEYRRHAGLIGVNASARLSMSEYSENTDESFRNPSLSLEFTKDTGRTTGTLGFAALRASRADPAANARTDSWQYSSDFNFKYPLSERNSLSGGLAWSERQYQGGNAALVDLTTLMASLDWFHVYTTERDLIAGYRIRLSETSDLTEFADHSFTVGVSGRIIPKLNGTARIGYQVRQGIGDTTENFTGYNAAISATWNLSKRISLTGQILNDFSTTSTNVTIDALAGTLDLQYAANARLALAAGVGGGINKFLGLEGEGRKDTFFNAYGRISYVFSERLRLGLTYAYFKNWSTDSFSDFNRNSLTFEASSRF